MRRRLVIAGASLAALTAALPGLAPAAQELDVAATVTFLEGPTVDTAGNVYFTDLNGSRILVLPADGSPIRTFRQPSYRANGLRVDAAGRLLACESGDRAMGIPARVTRTDLQTGHVEVLADHFQGQPFTSPNDITFDGQGRLYFTDLAGGAVYRIDVDGTLSRILARPEIERPNGVVISPDDRTFYLVEANQAEGGARMIRAYDLQADGRSPTCASFTTSRPAAAATACASTPRAACTWPPA